MEAWDLGPLFCERPADRLYGLLSKCTYVITGLIHYPIYLGKFYSSTEPQNCLHWWWVLAWEWVIDLHRAVWKAIHYSQDWSKAVFRRKACMSKCTCQPWWILWKKSCTTVPAQGKKKRPGQCLKGLSSCNGLDSLIVLSMMCFSYIAIYTSCLWMYASISCSYAISCLHAYIKQKLYEYKLCMYRSINTARWW